MKNLVQAMLVAGFFLVLHASSAQATIEHMYGPPGELCSLGCGKTFQYPVRQGSSTTITVQGQYVDLSTGLEATGNGVTVSSAGTSSSNKKIKVVVSADAAPGLHTIKLHYAVELNGPDTFQILVVRAGRVTDVDVPSPDQFFNDVDITLNGNNLDNADVILVPNTIATFVGGGSQSPQLVTLTQSDGTAQVVSSTNDRTVVRVHFNGGPFAEGKGKLVLFDKQLTADTCRQHVAFCYGGTDNDRGESSFHVLGPNAVSSITFPLGNSIQQGSLVSIKITLVRPAALSIFRGIGNRNAGSQGGETVRWQVVPSTSFEAAPGSGTQFSPTGDNPGGENTVRIPPGDQSIILTIRLRQVPAGCPQSGCSAQVKTRTGNFNTDQSPFLKTAAFTMVPPVQ